MSSISLVMNHPIINQGINLISTQFCHRLLLNVFFLKKFHLVVDTACVIIFLNLKRFFLRKMKKSKSSKPVSYKERGASMPADMVQAWIWRSHILISTFNDRISGLQLRLKIDKQIAFTYKDLRWPGWSLYTSCWSISSAPWLSCNGDS